MIIKLSSFSFLGYQSSEITKVSMNLSNQSLQFSVLPVLHTKETVLLDRLNGMARHNCRTLSPLLQIRGFLQLKSTSQKTQPKMGQYYNYSHIFTFNIQLNYSKSHRYLIFNNTWNHNGWGPFHTLHGIKSLTRTDQVFLIQSMDHHHSSFHPLYRGRWHRNRTIYIFYHLFT